MRVGSLVIVFASWFPIAGCGGSSSAGGTPVSATDFPARFASEWCTMIKRCCEASGGTADEACETMIAAEMTTRGNEAAADGATWDSTTAGRCLAGLKAADCSGTDVGELVALLDTCDDTWIGVVPPGGPCMTYSSCAEPPVSGGASAGASCVNSMCVQVVRQPVGAACSTATTTATTMLCDPLAAECSGGVCVALPGNGETCAGDCRAGLQCTNGMCTAALGAGAACTADSECASDRCSAGTCASVLAASADHCTLP